MALTDQFAPKIHIDCDNLMPGCVVSALHGGEQVHYYRLRAIAKTLGLLHGATVHLTQVRINGEIIFAHESRQLTFAPHHQNDALSKTLTSEVPAFIDVLLISDSGIVRTACKNREPLRRLDGSLVFSTPGEYVISVSVGAESISSQIAEITFNWSGEWQTSTLKI